jgi:ParB family chromosome partitioning protein
MKPRRHERRTRMIFVDHVVMDEGPRPLDPKAVDALARNLAAFGMHTPITVEVATGPDGFMSPDPDRQYYRVISGRHRVAAAQSLGWETIEALDFLENPYFEGIMRSLGEGDEEPDYEIAARMWAIAENLNRNELTALQRSEQIAEWIELEKKWRGEVARVSSQVATKPLGGRPEGGVRAAARDLGLDKDEANRAVKVASLSDEAKAVAVETKLDDKQTILLAAVKEKEAGRDDVVFLRQEHARREAEKARKEAERANRDTDRVIALTEAEQFADWLLARSDLNELPTLISWLEGTKAKDVTAALRRQAA